MFYTECLSGYVFRRDDDGTDVEGCYDVTNDMMRDVGDVWSNLGCGDSCECLADLRITCKGKTGIAAIVGTVGLSLVR